MRAVAEALGLKGASSYQRYEDENLYTRAILPLEMAAPLGRALIGKGVPPIGRDELMDLFSLKGEDGRSAAEMLHLKDRDEWVRTAFADARKHNVINRPFMLYISAYIDAAFPTGQVWRFSRGLEAALNIHDMFFHEADQIMKVSIAERIERDLVGGGRDLLSADFASITRLAWRTAADHFEEAD
jgi:hypothetical protein